MAGLNIGVVIGRFQVPELHEGHLHLFNEVITQADRAVIFLGVSPLDGYASEYPLTFGQRKTMLERCLPSGIDYIILPLPDRRTDDEWTAQIDAVLDATFHKDAVTLYGGRDSFTEHYKGKHTVKRLTFCPLIPVAGTEIRKAIKEANPVEFLRGQIHTLVRQWPKAYPTVDIAHVRQTNAQGAEVLVIQRADTGVWCFPGGFVDPTDESYEAAAKRELQEEVGLTSEARLDYIGSCRINDWRYRGSRDKILTSFYLSLHVFGAPTPNYEEVQDFRWVHISYPSAIDHVGQGHKPLMEMLQTYAAEKVM